VKPRKPKRPAPVSFHDVSIISMVAGKEEKISTIIDNGQVKEWVAIGWLSLREARPLDYLKYPEVK
jgi:hypothetical protein